MEEGHGGENYNWDSWDWVVDTGEAHDRDNMGSMSTVSLCSYRCMEDTTLFGGGIHARLNDYRTFDVEYQMGTHTAL